jgi:hypothetical protein
MSAFSAETDQSLEQQRSPEWRPRNQLGHVRGSSRVVQRMQTLRNTPQSVAMALRDMRRRIAEIKENPRMGQEAKAEKIATARMRATVELDSLEVAAVSAECEVERALAAHRPSRSEVDEALLVELAAGRSRLILLFQCARHEVGGGGGIQTALPGWKPGSVIAP